MKLIRSILVLFIFVFFGAGSLLLGWIYIPTVSLFVKNKREYFSNVVHRLWKWFTQFIIKTKIIDVKISGLEDYSGVKGKIIAATHPSLIDIVLLIGLFPKSLCIAKKELLNNIFLKNIVKNIYIINDIDVENFKKEAKSALDEGYNIVIFPTGTRCSKGEEFKIYKGASVIQIATGADILPVIIECDEKFLQKNQPVFQSGKKTVTYNIKIKPEIKLNTFTKNYDSEIKLRQAISAEIKNSFAGS